MKMNKRNFEIGKPEWQKRIMRACAKFGKEMPISAAPAGVRKLILDATPSAKTVIKARYIDHRGKEMYRYFPGSGTDGFPIISRAI